MKMHKFRESPVGLLVVVVSSIFVAESVSNGIAHFFQPNMSELAIGLVDSALLLILLSPVLHFFLFQPLLHSLTERRLAEEAPRMAMEKDYRTFVDTTMDAFWILDQQGRILDLNPSMSLLMGYSRDELLTMSIYDVLEMGDHAIVSLEKERIEGTGFRRFEAGIHVKNGKTMEVEISAALAQSGARTFAFLRDITEIKQNERALRKAKEDLEEKVETRTSELRAANDQLALRSAEMEMQNRVISAIGKMGELLSSCDTTDEAYAVISTSASRLFPDDTGALFILNSSRNLIEPACSWGDDSVIHEEIDPKSCWALRRGRCYSMEDSDAGLRCPHLPASGQGHFCLPLMAHGETLGVVQLLLGCRETEGDLRQRSDGKYRLFSNLAEKIEIAVANLKLSEALRNLSVRDPLTGLYNRRFMEEFFEREHALADRRGTSLGIIMFDIDLFKRFNDTFGHEAGDAVIRQLGVLIRRHVRGSDIACRYGGEEFTVIMPGATIETVRKRAEELRAEAARMQVEHNDRSLGPITLSLGVAVFPEHGSTTDAALRAADAALYRAKKEGRDRVCACEKREVQCPTEAALTAEERCVVPFIS